MNKVKFLFRSINLLNIILLASALLLAYYVVLPMLNMKVKYIPDTPKQISTVKEEEPAEGQVLSPSDYFIIAEQNLFHPERKIPPEKKEEQALPMPEFILYGTLITDNISFAYLEDLKSPRTTPGRGKRQTALKKGDTLSGYTLAEIEADKIVMVRGDDKMLLYVVDPKSPKTREASAPVTKVAPYRPASTPAKPPAASTPQRTTTTKGTSAPITKVAPYRPASAPAKPPAASTPQSAPIVEGSPSRLSPADQKVLDILQTPAGQRPRGLLPTKDE